MTFTRVSKRKAEYEGKQKKPLKKGEKTTNGFFIRNSSASMKGAKQQKKNSKRNNQKKRLKTRWTIQQIKKKTGKKHLRSKRSTQRNTENRIRD